MMRPLFPHISESVFNYYLTAIFLVFSISFISVSLTFFLIYQPDEKGLYYHQRCYLPCYYM
jgi:hypothetical protein